MRLRPVAPLILFEAAADTTVADVEIPAGTNVLVLSRPPVRDPARFVDPEAFRPERWLEQGLTPHDAAAHIPFGSGPRICPGRSLALLEMKVVLGMLYRNFSVVRREGQRREGDLRLHHGSRGIERAATPALA